MPPTARAIDALPAPSPSSTPSMKVLVLAAPRSGSTSLGSALTLLGYKTCIGVAHSYFHENHFPYWTEAIDIKYHGKEGESYGKEGGEFERFLGGYEAVTGWGAALMGEEMVEAYPEAKVIVTGRDAEAWVGSFLPAWSYGHPLDKEEQKRYYLDHNERMRKLVPADRFLVFDSKDGWEPLCKFLGKDVPTTPYPHAGVRTGFHSSMQMIWRRTVLRAARNVGAAAVVTALLVMAVRKYWLGGRLPVVPYSLVGRR
ncbi:hypothetical protein PRZ48_001078 [Zasmidium cellare]|uniref:P-loop containing nucleoside triphosphate hydrolase protein n=1 Tax=Zasmidium cellare TaxID=395010 RepID=A0ABR0F1Y5_ZASCE|nr:hypothetical protein PRZ48_001078 [Zasmidium cellare]